MRVGVGVSVGVGTACGCECGREFEHGCCFAFKKGTCECGWRAIDHGVLVVDSLSVFVRNGGDAALHNNLSRQHNVPQPRHVNLRKQT